jgi:hypothetical protein
MWILIDAFEQAKCHFFVGSLPEDPSASIDAKAPKCYQILRIKGPLLRLSVGQVQTKHHLQMSQSCIESNMRRRVFIRPMQTHAITSTSKSRFVMHADDMINLDYHDVRLDLMSAPLLAEFQNLFQIENLGHYIHPKAYRVSS